MALIVNPIADAPFIIVINIFRFLQAWSDYMTQTTAKFSITVIQFCCTSWRRPTFFWEQKRTYKTHKQMLNRGLNSASPHLCKWQTLSKYTLAWCADATWHHSAEMWEYTFILTAHTATAVNFYSAKSGMNN